MLTIFALVWAVSVWILTWAPVKERAQERNGHTGEYPPKRGARVPLVDQRVPRRNQGEHRQGKDQYSPEDVVQKVQDVSRMRYGLRRTPRLGVLFHFMQKGGGMIAAPQRKTPRLRVRNQSSVNGWARLVQSLWGYWAESC